MLQVYKGVIKNGKVILENKIPIDKNSEVLVIVENDQDSLTQNKKKILELVKKTRGAWKNIKNLDPMEYQKKMRNEWKR